MSEPVNRTHAGYRLSGDTAVALTLTKSGRHIGSVTKCASLNGWWHKSGAICAYAVILPTAKSALLALIGPADPEATSAVHALLPGREAWPPTP